MKKLKVCSIILCVALFACFFALSAASGMEAVSLQNGIDQYRQENYDEAIDILNKVREQDPKSSIAAFFLGMAYKQINAYEKASAQLREALTLTPHVKEAMVEYIDVLYQRDELSEAEKWVAVAEKEQIAPARVFYLRGLILGKQNKNQEAIEAFEKAKSLDPALRQAAEFQIAVCFMKERKFDKAKARLEVAASLDPMSDLAAYARHYQDMVEKGLYMTRPIRLTLGVFGAYDTNLLAKPVDAAQIGAGDITDEASGVLNSYVRVDYVPRLEGPWLFSAQYAANSSINQKHTHTNDYVAQTISAAPGYNFGRFTITLNPSFTSALLRTDPDTIPSPDSSPGYKRYLDYFSIGPTFRFLVTQNNIVDVYGGYDKKEYYNQRNLGPAAMRDAVGPRAYVSWVWLFTEAAFLNLRYDFNRDHADGVWWENDGHRVTLNVSVPLFLEETAKKFGPLNLQLTGGMFLQNYKYEQPFVAIDGTLQSDKRKDKTYSGSAGLNWEFYENASFIVQYTRTECHANMPANEYNRNLYSAGFEYRL